MKRRIRDGASKAGFSIDKIISSKDDYNNHFCDVYSEDFYLLSKEERVNFYKNLDDKVLNRWYQVSIYSGDKTFDWFYEGITFEEYSEEEENEKVARENELKEEYESVDMPYLGMREEGLLLTKIGKPNKIEKCTDFEHLKISHKYKKYTWYHTSNGIDHLEVTVRYKKHYSRNTSDYEELPDDNGFVSEIWKDKNGRVSSENYNDSL